MITNCTLEINYSLNDYRNNIRWDNKLAGEMVKRIVVNSNDVVVQDRSPVNPNDVEYIIITDQSLVDEFEPLAEWKTQKGVPTDIVTTDFIISHYEGQNSSIRIKNCIKDYYENKGTSYVLLGGDPSIIPAVLCYGYVHNSDENPQDNYTGISIPTDLFYSCLDDQFDWNADSDIYLGEIEDNIDMVPEVFVGRIAVSTSQNAIASQFVNKTIRYEKYTSYPTMGNYSHKMLMAGMQIMNPLYNPTYYNGLSDSDYYSRLIYNEVISPWGNPLYLFDTSNCSYNGTTLTLNHSNFITLFNSGFNIINWSSHGYDTAWGGTDGYTLCPAYLDNLTNVDSQGIIYTTACKSNNFNHAPNQDCLGELLTGISNGGAIAYIGASDNNWYNYSNPPATNFAKEFYRPLFNQSSDNNTIIGNCLAESKIALVGSCNSYNGANGASRWSIFSLNLLGDPELKLWTENPTLFSVLLPDHFYSGSNSSNYPLIISTGVSNASVCVTNNHDVYQYGTTDLSGLISFNVNTASQVLNVGVKS